MKPIDSIVPRSLSEGLTESATVLAIDDSTEVLALLAVRLRPEGVKLVTARTAQEGLRLAAEASPDLILLDVDMPDESGLEICGRLKQDPATSLIPIIFLTASGDIETKVACFDLGATDYVTKPFHPAELRARVRAALRMKRAQDMLTRRAQVDALTGLSNRAFFDGRLAAEVQTAVATRRPVSLVMIDLDHFKSLNDAYGHPFGDLVLQRVGDLVARSVRPGDAACRYGGEELSLILSDTDADRAFVVATRVREALRALEFSPRGAPIRVTASFGVAEALAVESVAGVETRELPQALVAAADEALYAAKRAGRDCAALYVAERREPRADGSKSDVPASRITVRAA